MHPEAITTVLEILEGKSQLSLDHMTIIVTGDLTCGEFKYRFPQSDTEYRMARPESWKYFDIKRLTIGDVVSLLCIRETTERGKKNLYPIELLEISRDHTSAKRQSLKWNSRIDAPYKLVEFALTRINVDPVTYVALQNAQMEEQTFRTQK